MPIICSNHSKTDGRTRIMYQNQTFFRVLPINARLKSHILNPPLSLIHYKDNVQMWLFLFFFLLLVLFLLSKGWAHFISAIFSTISFLLPTFSFLTCFFPFCFTISAICCNHVSSVNLLSDVSHIHDFFASYLVPVFLASL